MKISDDCFFSPEAEKLKAEWYYENKILSSKTDDEAQAYALFWYCTNQLIDYKWKVHERSLRHGRGKANT